MRLPVAQNIKLKTQHTMKVEIQSRKLVIPSSPTPPSFAHHDISFTDELAPTLNVPLILYYGARNDNAANIVYHLEKSLEPTLSKFYPLAGRYIKNTRSVDCSDLGAEFVHAKVNIKLDKAMEQVVCWPDELNKFLPREIGEADEIDDPVVSIQINVFECGGLAIGMCFSHRICDMTTMTAFINNWAGNSRDERRLLDPPLFNSAALFPPKGVPKLDLRVPRTPTGVDNALKRILFKEKAISALRSKAGFDPCGPRPSKIQLVVALLWQAFVRMDQEKSEQFNASFLIQPVNLREKVVPQLPNNSCGNLWGIAASQLTLSKSYDPEFRDILSVLRDSVKKFIKDCAKVLINGEEGLGVVIDPFLESNRKIADDEINFYVVTSWCGFSFYESDFGWGKPVWASTAKLPVKNLVILIDEKGGDGVEAWVHLDEKDMVEFEKDPDIRALTTQVILHS